MALAAVAIAWLEPAEGQIAGQGAYARDGDTIRLGAHRIRLMGLDAPELDQTCKDAKGADWACGRASRDHLNTLLAGGPLECQPDGHDRYGRTLALCSVAGRDLGHRIVAEGLAIASGDYLIEEIEARSAGRGIWSGSFERPRDWRDRDTASPWDWLTNLLR